MATREIKTTIAIDGEQRFKQALSSASREMRVMESELRAVSAAYDTNGDAAAFFTAKQRNLQGQIRQQEQIVQSLERAVRDSAEAFGEASPQVDGYSIKLNNARTRLSRLQKELNSTDREVEELGRDSIKAGRQIEQGISESAENAEKDVRSLMETLKDDISSIRANTTFTAIGSMWDMAKDAYSAVDSFVGGTLEYRRQLSFLEQNALDSGFGIDSITDKMIEVQATTADASAAIEGLSNLLQIEGIDEYRLDRIMKNLLGASVKWPDTLQFQSLSDSLQETLATGGAVGAYAELLERLGKNVEEFNEALKESPTMEGDIDTAISYLESKELSDAYEEYKKNNEDLIKELTAVAKLEFQSARVGNILANNITTPVKESFANTLDYIADTLELWETEGAEAAVSKITKDVESSKKALIEETKNLAETVAENISPSSVIEKYAEEKGLDELASNAKMVGEVQKNIWEGIADAAKWLNPWHIADEMKAIMYTDPTENQNVERFEEAGKEAGAAYINGLETQLDLSLFGEGRPAESHNLVTINPIETWEEMLQSGETDLIEAGKEAGEAVDEGFSASIEGMETAARETGASVAAAFGAGLASQISYVAASSAALAAAASAGLRAVGSLGPLKSAASTGVPVVINLDGRQVGSGLAPFTSEFIASSYDADVNIN